LGFRAFNEVKATSKAHDKQVSLNTNKNYNALQALKPWASSEEIAAYVARGRENPLNSSKASNEATPRIAANSTPRQSFNATTRRAVNLAATRTTATPVRATTPTTTKDSTAVIRRNPARRGKRSAAEETNV
jgi:hypothetical protein